MWLIRNGVQEDIAWDLSDAERLARCIAFAGFDGNEWDWRTLRFKERK